MKIYRMGSCRIFTIPDDFKCGRVFNNEAAGYTHTIKEHIQLIRYLRGVTRIPADYLQYIYTFCGGDQKLDNVDDIFAFNRQALEQANVYLVEVCSLKVIKYRDYYLQISRFTAHEKWNIPRPDEEMLNNYIQYNQDQEEFHNDFATLVKELGDKPIIFTGQLNLNTGDGERIGSRQRLNSLLESLCRTYGKDYYDLSDAIAAHPSVYVDADLIHLKPQGFYLARDYIANIIDHR